ncbi:hypothetical protein K1719_019822 [Acacia pycnantha]|nr:hypothetical protein K1719_019822 [Acacia pycnantha]
MGRSAKENIPMEVLEWEEEMEVSDPIQTDGQGFVFKAKGGRRKKVEAVDCWNVPKLVTFVYGPPKEGERRVAWEAPRTFKFEANWVKHVDFLKVVSSSWNEAADSKADCLLDLIQRLDMCRIRLTEWNQKLKEAEYLVGQIEEAWNKEETYWWQRSRISWLSCGDRNTSFFHSSVIQRRLRNKVLTLEVKN